MLGIREENKDEKEKGWSKREREQKTEKEAAAKKKAEERKVKEEAAKKKANEKARKAAEREIRSSKNTVSCLASKKRKTSLESCQSTLGSTTAVTSSAAASVTIRVRKFSDCCTCYHSFAKRNWFRVGGMQMYKVASWRMKWLRRRIWCRW